MIKKQGLLQLHNAVKAKLAANTQFVCHDRIPEERGQSCYWIEISEKQHQNTKTCFQEKILIYIHVLPDLQDGIEEEYEMIQQAEQALTERLQLPEGINVISQTYEGMERKKTEETIEKHAVLSYGISISYGFEPIV